MSMDNSYEDNGRSNDGRSFGSYDGNSMRGSYGYSGHNMVEKLERMYDESHDEKERRMIGEFIQRAEKGR